MTVPWHYVGALLGAVAVHAPLFAGAMFVGPQQARSSAKRSELVAIVVAPSKVEATPVLDPPVSVKPTKPEPAPMLATTKPALSKPAPNEPVAESPAPQITPTVTSAPEPSALPSAANVLVAAPSAGASTSITSGHGSSLGGSTTGGAFGIGAPGAGSTGPSAGTDGHGTAARLAGSAEWDCPFPSEADDDDVDHAVVTLNLTIDPDGQVSKVAAVADPGHGFAREAKACARSKRWVPAMAGDGRATTSSLSVKVRFDR